MTLKYPSVLLYKITRRLRQYGELFFPKWWLNYHACPIDAGDCFNLWAEQIPLELRQLKTKLISQHDIGKLVSSADSVCEHRFDLLGSTPYSFSEKIDWHLDFKTGFRWPKNVLHSQVRKTTESHADIKIPWELSRFHQAVTLSLAWQCTHDEKYLTELLSQIEDGIDNNPVGYGVNWACPMDVAIRSVNWLVALAIAEKPMKKENYFSFRQKVVSSLWQHAGFLRTHMEWLGPHAKAGANHLLLDLTGLFALGVFFKGTKEGDSWLHFAYSQLEFQIMRQVSHEGIHFECSISYHRLCFEAFLWCGSLAKRLNLPFSADYYDRLNKMQQFVSSYSKPNGLAPLIGDNDDGRLLTAGLSPINDHRYLTSDNSDETLDFDQILLDGTTSFQNDFSIDLLQYPQSGFFFLKNDSAHLLMRAGPLAYSGTHAHNDQLSFELSLGVQDIFVDRGTYVYSVDTTARNLYRSTAAHNVLQINEQEQNPIEVSIFSMQDQTQSRMLNQSADSLEAVHYGFKSLNRPGAEYRRRISLSLNKLVISDNAVPLKNNDVLKWFFHLAPGLTTNISRGKVCIMRDSNLLCILTTSPEMEISVHEFPHSPSYGVLQQAKTIQLRHTVLDGQITNTFKFAVSWDLK